MHGRRHRPDHQLQAFRDALDDYGLMDLGYKGYPFTWCNNRDPTCTTWFKSETLRFEENWTSDEGCLATIKEAWLTTHRGTAMFQVANKLRDCKKRLGIWSRRMFGNVTRQLADKRQRLMAAEEAALHRGGLACTKDLKSKINFLLEKEERLWRQRSRASWGVWRDDNEVVVALLLRYYKDLFKSSMPTQIDEAIAHVTPVVTQAMNEDLTRVFTAGRLITNNVLVAFETLHHMHSTKIGKEGAMALKLDMSKAYDHMEWLFLDKIMRKLGFHPRWDILSIYEHASGQQINRDKTTIFFSKATLMVSQDAIKNTLGVPIIRQYKKYLGLSSLIGRNRAASFTQIKERFWRKLKGWKEKILSQAGREILIKAVAQAIPTYAMSYFKLLARLCKELEAMIRRSGDSSRTPTLFFTVCSKPNSFLIVPSWKQTPKLEAPMHGKAYSKSETSSPGGQSEGWGTVEKFTFGINAGSQKSTTAESYCLAQ
uniref:Reverse transcriptase domain-containing protein n=1 Tax=Fagus sylvatica TaxID=28930 RepID=A0A2N9I391_FAGSY